jgi:hypothetical protein
MDALADPSPTPEQLLSQQVLLAVLERLIAEELTDRQRQALVRARSRQTRSASMPAWSLGTEKASPSGIEQTSRRALETSMPRWRVLLSEFAVLMRV